MSWDSCDRVKFDQFNRDFKLEKAFASTMIWSLNLPTQVLVDFPSLRWHQQSSVFNHGWTLIGSHWPIGRAGIEVMTFLLWGLVSKLLEHHKPSRYIFVSQLVLVVLLGTLHLRQPLPLLTTTSKGPSPGSNQSQKHHRWIEAVSHVSLLKTDNIILIAKKELRGNWLPTASRASFKPPLSPKKMS